MKGEWQVGGCGLLVLDPLNHQPEGGGKIIGIQPCLYLVCIFSFVAFATNRYFSSVRAVLQGACHMVALQISSEPMVRQALRQVFQSRAVLSVKPTKKGKKVCVFQSHTYVG